MEVVSVGISVSSFGATSWSFPAMTVWFEVINPSKTGKFCGLKSPGARAQWA